MLIKTRDFGEVDIPEEKVICFPEGIYAFEENKRYVIISPFGDNVYPMWLQCADNADLSFIVFSPSEFTENYHITVDGADKDLIELTDEDEIFILAIAVAPEDYKETTINLKSPIIINMTNNKAVQTIVPENYPVKFSAFLKEGV